MTEFLGKKITIVTGEPWDFSDYNNGKAEIYGIIKESYDYNEKVYYFVETKEFFFYDRKYNALLISPRYKYSIVEDFHKNGIATINGKCLNNELKSMIISDGGNNFAKIYNYISENLLRIDGVIGSIHKIE